MAFNILKEWIYAGISRSRSRHGKIAVANEGEAIITVNFAPTFAEAQFSDPEPPIDPCHPHAPDYLDFDIVYIGGRRWGVKIKWNVASVRQIKYQINGYA